MPKRILLVEDDPFLSSLLGNRLKREGFEVFLVKDGSEALKAMRAQPVDLVLLDIILPGKSGFEVLEDIKGDPQISNLPVIIISNLGQETDIEKGKELGVIDYIVKARISIDDLIKKAREFLR